MILIIDNYDSFTYNLVHLVAEKTGDYKVFRNDKLTIDDIRQLNPSKILISPGPGRPENAGITPKIIQELGAHCSILGVCLGHQAIGMVYGGDVIYAPTLMHGKTSLIDHDGSTIFEGVKPMFIATRYHSLVLDPKTLPDSLQVTSRTPDGVIMGVRHKEFKVEGIQFHPESILTEEGPKIISNWLNQ